MSNFNQCARRVRDEGLPEGIRYLAFLWAIQEFHNLTEESFQYTFERLASHFGFTWGRASGKHLVAATDVLAAERNQYLEKLRQFERLRIRRKSRGRRYPSKEETERLKKCDWLIVPPGPDVLKRFGIPEFPPNFPNQHIRNTI